ncbi:type II toxin-antitoxin system VapB family antitoxin [bacterium]|nr:type II toxin-antitoxin system VapB family antitoxin [bacterium]
MATNLDLDDKLIIQAQKIGKHRTKRETVTAALEQYIAHKKQQEIVELFGEIDFDPGYDYKKARKR